MQQTEFVTASKKRVLFSWFIDLIFFLAIWGLLDYMLNHRLILPAWVPLGIFAAIRTVTGRFIGSIGNSFLCIGRDGRITDHTVFSKESWLTMLLGLLLVLEGTKHLVRWTQEYVPLPVFGFFPDVPVQVSLHVAYGILSVLSGYWFFKLNIKGLYLGLGMASVTIVSTLSSWHLWDPVVEHMVIARRHVQGIPIKSGEVEFMQALFPEGMLVASILAIAAMLCTYMRLSKR